MADNNTIARPYAQAVFELANAAGELSAWSESLDVAGQFLEDDGLVEYLSTPALSDEKRLEFLGGLFKSANAPKLAGGNKHGDNFLKLLLENKDLFAQFLDGLLIFGQAGKLTRPGCGSNKILSSFLIVLVPSALHPILEVDAAEKHFESFGFEVEFGIGLIAGLGSTECALFQSFHQNPKTRPIPIEELYTITPFVEEDEEFGGQRVFLELFFDDAGQSVEALAQVAGLSGEADRHAMGEDHARARGGELIRRRSPPGKVSSTTFSRVTSVAAGAVIGTSTLMNSGEGLVSSDWTLRRQFRKLW